MRSFVGFRWSFRILAFFSIVAMSHVCAQA